jgi:hypothetical protein
MSRNAVEGSPLHDPDAQLQQDYETKPHEHYQADPYWR